MTQISDNATAKKDVRNWHALPVDQAFDILEGDESGLSSGEAGTRVEKFGPNRLRPPARKSLVRQFLAQFHNLLIYVLIAAAIVTALIGHLVDSGVIIAVVLINAIIGVVQEGKAEKALDAIRHMLSQQALVRRDGNFVLLPAEELVPGDIVSLQSGDKVPADVRLFKTRELRIDEAMLTGESEPVEKQTQPVPGSVMVGDRSCMAHSGTLVTYGQGQGLVVATGDNTEIGRISGMLGQVQPLVTPLLRDMAHFSRWLTIAIVIIAAVTFLFGVSLKGYTPADMFLAAVGLAVAAIPEGLPAIMTITLAIGVQRMARRNAIIRRLPAVETLGSVTVICSDKTGTLTRNEMTVQAVATTSGIFSVGGIGYNPHGDITLNDEHASLDMHPDLAEVARAALLCNDARLIQENDQWKLHGEPTEGSLLTFALKAGLDQDSQLETWPRTDAIPFESQHRFMATLHHDHNGHAQIYLKGAPEQVLAMCAHQMNGQDHEPLDRAYWEEGMETLASQGLRLLAIARREVDYGQQSIQFADVGHDLTLLGIVGIIDPPRDEATQAVRTCQSAGIQIKMITGDHATTASAIGKRMAIGDGKHVITGADIEALDDTALQQAVERYPVFARTSPEHKLKLVKALQASGHVVAMTGDGVNDAPALKRADVGIAMGIKGSEVAKESAEMVLADDNFASIAVAVEEGRAVYDNLKKSILFVLPTNGGEALTIIAAILFGRMLPIIPVQILWVNMITAVTLALTLAFEPAESDVMRRRPRSPGEPLLSRFLVWRILFVSLILVAGTYGLFHWERTLGTPIETARTIAVNTLVAFEIFYLLSARYLLAPALTRAGLTGNPYIYYAIGILIVMQLLFTYAPPMQHLFQTTALSLATWGQILLVASSVLFLVEIEKALLRRRLQK